MTWPEFNALVPPYERGIYFVNGDPDDEARVIDVTADGDEAHKTKEIYINTSGEIPGLEMEDLELDLALRGVVLPVSMDAFDGEKYTIHVQNPALPPRSYLISSANKYYFDELEPSGAVAAFNKLCNNGSATTTIAFTTANIVKNTVSEIVFGSDISGVTAVGNYFLTSFTLLNSVDFAPLANLQTIGDNFLSQCNGLQSVDLAPLANLQSLGTYAFRQCAGLQSVDLSALVNLSAFGAFFSFGCANLNSVKFPVNNNLPTIIVTTMFMQSVPSYCVLLVPDDRITDYTTWLANNGFSVRVPYVQGYAP
jgi:hypothetical protein